MECRAVGRRCATGSATLLGDLAQGTSPAAATSWPQLLADLGKGDAGLRVLDTGWRAADHGGPRRLTARPPVPGVRRGHEPAGVRRGDRRGRAGSSGFAAAAPG